MTLTIAHLSDVHLPPMPRLALRHMRLKRGLGLLNWQLKRRAIHRVEVIQALLADLARQRPDHIAVTGDLVNIGLPEEHAAALGWLEALGAPDRVSVVPGNHDVYVPMHRDIGVGRWQAYMASDAWGAALTVGWQGFPYVRKVGPVGLIGLNSALPMPPFVAAGRLGTAQLARLSALLSTIRSAGLARVVLIHHPPLPGQASRRRGLQDADALAEVVHRHGAELILHGHNHRRVEARAGAAVALGVPSFSAGLAHHDEPLGCYNLIRVIQSGPHRHIEVVARGLATPGGPVVEIERRRLDVMLAASA